MIQTVVEIPRTEEQLRRIWGMGFKPTEQKTVQVVIEIDKEAFTNIEVGAWQRVHPDTMYKAIENGTPLPDNATNGDVMKAMFNTTEEHFYDEDRMVDVYGLDRNDDPSTFYADWWNSPYQKGGKE